MAWDLVGDSKDPCNIVPSDIPKVYTKDVMGEHYGQRAFRINKKVDPFQEI